MKRDELKSLIKECLIEILAEGLSTKPNVNSINKKNVVSSSSRSTNVPQQRNLEVKNQKTNIISSQKQSGHNNIMSAIFEDTMRNTVPKMAKAEASHFRHDYHSNNNMLHDSVSSPYVQKFDRNREISAEDLVESSTPEDLFGEEAAEKWSKIAFNDINK